MEYRTCGVCGETKEAVRGSWVTRKSKPEGKICIKCKAADSLQRYNNSPTGKTRHAHTAKKLRATEAGLMASRAASRKYAASALGKLKIATDYATRMLDPSVRVKHSAVSLRWARNNPDKANIKSLKRKLSKLRRTVAWADNQKIAAFYNEAALLTMTTGVRHSVDHIIPLRGKLVSGLHVHNNLQILTQSENSRKGNKWQPE